MTVGSTGHGVTVIVHGYQLFGTIPAWPNEIAEGIRDRITAGRIWGWSVGLAEFVVTSPFTGDAENILVFNWAGDSNDNFTGHTEAAAEALFTALVAGASGNSPQWDISQIHLIGHSRGAVVVSETAQRLLAAGYDVEHLTFLDPVWQGALGQATDFDVNANHPTLGPEGRGVAAWDSATYVDNFYSTDDNGEFIEIDGSPIDGARNLNLSGRGTGVGHSDVWRWYYGTIDTTATGIDGGSVQSAWYGGSNLARSLDGWNQGRLIAESRSPMTGTRTPVAFDWDVDGIVNGDLERGPQGSQSATRPDPGWDTYGGGGSGLVQSNEILLQIGNEDRTHNPVWVPPDFARIAYTYDVQSTAGGDPDTLVSSAILLSDEQTRLGITPLTTTGSDTITVDVSAFAGEVLGLRFELISGGVSVGSVVTLDDVHFSPTPIGVTFAGRLFLEGPFSGFGTMSTNLTEDIPNRHPFGGPPWSFASDDSVTVVPVDAVDWVLVELRADTASETAVSRRAGLLDFSGYIRDIDGADSLRFDESPPGQYFVVVYHRNHIPVMSSAKVDLSSGIGGWDFTPSASAAFGAANPTKGLPDGSYGLFACDINADGQIIASDFNEWLTSTKLGETGYLMTDCDLDGQVTASDFNLWLANTKAGAASQVP